MFSYMEKVRIQDLHFKFDSSSGLRAIIAIHNTSRGPGLGGCRLISYPSTEKAVEDAIRLAEGMSYKAALAGLPQGGAKAVILKPEKPFSRKKLFSAFSNFVNELGGRYITAIDSGSTVEDMDIVAKKTSHVVGTTIIGDPSPFTAQGVFEGILSCLRLSTRLPDTPEGVTVAIQGVGNVGFILAELLHQSGAKLIVCDPDKAKTRRCHEKFNAEVVRPEDIYQTKCDIFSPCGLGGVLNRTNIPKLQCKIIAGSANNQLCESSDGELLQKKGILYAPDYLVNAGGLIFVSLSRIGNETEIIKQHITQIGHTLENLINLHHQTGKSMSELVDLEAKHILYGTFQTIPAGDITFLNNKKYLSTF